MIDKDSVQAKIKQEVGKKAAELVQDGMLVGLGTGSTATCFIESLADRCRQGLKITTVATSERSSDLAKSKGIPVVSLESVSIMDLTIDGADEIDPKKRLIKGGGGALLREKILATSSKEMVVIADEFKLVTTLGAFGLPVEIVPFAHNTTIKKINDLGLQGSIRSTKDGHTYITDNHNFIYDIHFKPVCNNPEEVANELKKLTGVVETGFFIGIAGRIMIGYANGDVKIFEKLPTKA